MRYLKKLLIGCFSLLVLFTAATILVNGTVSDSLIYSFFGAFGAEIVVSAIIKITEEKEGVKRDTEKAPDTEPDIHKPHGIESGICDRPLDGDSGETDERQALG